MSEALNLAENLYRQFMNDETNFDTMIEASIELRRLAAVEQAYEALKASLGDPVAFLVEGWNDKKRIACVLSHNIEDAKFSAGEFSQHYPTIHTRNLYALKQPT